MQQKQQQQRRSRVTAPAAPLLALVLLVSAGTAAVGAAAPGCRGKIPGCATNQCVNRLVNGVSTMVCPDPGCDGPLYKLTPDQTRCDCVPGAYAECNATVPCTCQACTPGNFCPGGRIPSAALRPCGAGLTTLPGVVATSLSQCALLPGYGWLSATAAAPALCRIGTYSPGGVTGRIACTRCPSGLTTVGVGAPSKDYCIAPPGAYVDYGSGRGTSCPVGTFQPNYTTGSIAACQACPVGVTTAALRTKTAGGCSVMLPGYGVATPACNSDACQAAATAALCAVGTYNEGGVGSSLCKVCPNGMTTRAAGSATVNDCLVPPGYGLDPATQQTVPCVGGYNPGWNRAACTSCGVNVASFNNRTSRADCFVLAGQGLQASTGGSVSTRVATTCPVGSFGMANDTLADVARPCDTCPRFMTTAAPGATGRSSCRPQPGFTLGVTALGVNGSVACAVGTYKPLLGNEACTVCPGNSTTPDVGSTDASQCSLCPAGTGSATATPPLTCTLCPANTFNNGSSAQCQPCPPATRSLAGSSSCSSACPVGTYRVATGDCLSCPGNTTTPAPGAESPANCTLCAAGFGGWTAAPSCSACALNSYSSGNSTSCTSCPANTNTSTTASAFVASCVAGPGYSTGPTACPIGTYKDKIGNTTCTPCPNNTTTLVTAATSVSQCSVCVAGFGAYTASPAPSCSACPLGFYGVGSVTTCQACPANTNTTTTGNTNAAACAAAPGYSTGPVACPIGTFKQNTGNVSCSQCPNNTNTLGTASTSSSQCSVCASGYGSWTATSCSACPIGQFSVGTSTTCSSCPNNTTTLVTAATNQSQCSVCVAGFGAYTASPTPTCSACLLNTYSVGGVPTCQACPANTNTTATASTSVTACLPGLGYTGTPGNATACPIGTYKDTIGTGACTSCPNNTTTLVTAATNRSQCSVCVAGFGAYTASPAPSCSACPLGFYGVGNVVNCTACPANTNTANTTSTTPNACVASPGYSTGPVACPIGTYKQTLGNTSCIGCPSFTNTVSTASTSLSQCRVCVAGYGAWANVSNALSCTLCGANTYSPGNSSSCLPCFEGQTSVAGSSVCVDVTPAPSTCTPRPTTSSISIECPSASDNSWRAVQPDNNANLPGGCIPPNNNCNSAGGQFDSNTKLEAVTDPTAPNRIRCVCPNAAVTGAVPRLTAGGKLIGCNNTAVFLADNLSTPSSGSGIFVDDLAPAQQTCNSPQSCWDMCFFCNGYPRFQATATAGLRQGTARSANMTACVGLDCFTGDAVDRTLTFAQACNLYAAAASPLSNPLLTPTSTAATPYRADNTALYRYSVQPTFPTPLPAGTAVNRGQQPLRFFALI